MAFLNMQTIRYINLLDKVSNVKTSKCFVYNGTIIFAVPSNLVSKAIGPGAVNIRRIQESLGKRVRVMSRAEGKEDAERFVRNLVEPVSFKSVEVRDGELIIVAGSTQSKAALIGREKRRLNELSQIVKDTFSLDLRII